MARLVLIGLPGAGKTTVGAVLAERWGCSVIDTDDALAELVGMPAASYLREHGEAEFRDRELDALSAALAADAVVSTGAGVVTTSLARERLKEEIVVWLDCDDETLTARVGPGERPLLGDDHAEALGRLRRERTPWYEQSATVRIDATGNPEDVADRVHDALKGVRP